MPAHEVLEGTWKAVPAGERSLWQGLAQLAVGLTHLGRGNHPGAVTLLRRGAARITPYADEPPHGIDVNGLVGFATRLADDITSGATSTTEPPRLRRRR